MGVSNSMKPKTIKQIADAILKTLHDVGLPVDEFLSGLMASPFDDRSKDLVRQVVTNQITQDLAQLPEPTPEELTAWLATFDGIRTTPRLLRKKLTEIRKGLPRTPGGPTRRIPLTEELRVCAEVEGLETRGYDRPTAVLSVARQRRASKRTVYRILRKHGKTKPQKPRKTAVK